VMMNFLIFAYLENSLFHLHFCVDLVDIVFLVDSYFLTELEIFIPFSEPILL
jgi:hypothetical protein